MNWKTCACDDNPASWSGAALGIDLDAPGLRLRAQQICSGVTPARERALALFRHVAGLPFEISDDKLRTSPAALNSMHGGDAYFKASLLVHLLRLQDIPARMRWVQVEPKALTRGLWDFANHTGIPLFYPLTDIWLAGTWLCTDAYILDAPLLFAVRAELVRMRVRTGYFLHVDGVAAWDGRSDALQRFTANDEKSWPLRDLGCFHSRADFVQRTSLAVPETTVTKMVYANQALMMNLAFARLRAGS